MTSDFREFNSYIENIEKNLPKTLTQLGAYMQRETQKRFQQNKVKGPPLKPSTVENKGNSIKLVDDSILKNSVEYYTMPTYVMIGSSIKYGLFHQVGTKHIPKREWLFFTRNNAKDAITILIKGLFND
jgi:phage gpG-like protein